jgi:hypothetical protein
MTMTTIARRITGGLDTHLDVHVAAALDERGAFDDVPERAVGLAVSSWIESVAGHLARRSLEG